MLVSNITSAVLKMCLVSPEHERMLVAGNDANVSGGAAGFLQKVPLLMHRAKKDALKKTVRQAEAAPTSRLASSSGKLIVNNLVMLPLNPRHHLVDMLLCGFCCDYHYM